MEPLVTLVLFLVGLGLLDVLAMRYGADSRSPCDRRPNWDIGGRGEARRQTPAERAGNRRSPATAAVRARRPVGPALLNAAGRRPSESQALPAQAPRASSGALGKVAGAER